MLAATNVASAADFTLTVWVRKFDGRKLKITNKPEANKYLTRRYRKGYGIKRV